MVRTQSPYIKPVSKPVTILQSSTSSNSITPTLCLHAIIESQHLQVCPEMPFSHITSDFNSSPASPVRIVPIICRTTHTAEKNVNKLICNNNKVTDYETHGQSSIHVTLKMNNNWRWLTTTRGVRWSIWLLRGVDDSVQPAPPPPTPSKVEWSIPNFLFVST